MASASKLSKYVGRKGLARVAGTLQVPINVIDAREGYGRVDLLVTPQGGLGTAWIRLDNIELEPEVKS